MFQRSFRSLSSFTAAAMALFCAAGCPATEPPPAPQTLEQLVDQQVGSLVRAKKIVGAAVGVFREGELTTYYFGETKRGNGKVPDANTQYEIGSITKTLTASLLALMVSEGTVTLDTPVEELLPAGTVVPSLNGQKITLGHLASHFSGLPGLPTNLSLIGNLRDPYANYTRQDMFDFLAEYKLTRAPGTSYEYSNFGVSLLGFALAEKAGKPYNQLVKDRLFTPLGLVDSVLTQAEADPARLAAPYETAFLSFLGFPPREGSNWNLGVFAPAGAWISTLDDIAAYLRANMNAGDNLLAPAANLLYTARGEAGGNVAVALGWHILLPEAPGGREIIWHNGGTGGYNTFAGFIRGTQTGAIILANTAAEGEIDIAAINIIDGIGLLPAE